MMIKDKNIERVISESWAVSWPMTLIMFFEFLIGLSDIYIAGKFGKEVQAAYGLAFQLYFVFIISGMALTVGTVSVVSRLFTSEKKNELSMAVNSALISSVFTGFVATVIGIFFSSQIMHHLHTPSIVKVLATPLLIIYSFGFVFDYVLMNTNAILRACNMVRNSLWTMTLVCILNIALNFILAFFTPLGFKGIGVATVISLFMGAILNLLYTKRLIKTGFDFSFSVLKRIIDISWPAGLLQIFWQLGAITLFLIVSELPLYAIEVMAALTNGLKIESAIFLPAFAFNMANAVLVGNALGKNEKKDAFQRGIITAITGVFIVTLLTVIVMINAKLIASNLTNDSIVVDQTLKYIFIALLFEPIMAWGVILGGGLNGAGDTKTVMAVVVLCIWAIRIPLSYLLGIYFGLGPAAIWWSMNFSILAQSILITRRYLGKRWM